LDVSYCQALTDNGIALLGEIMGLKSLKLRGCKQITDVGVKKLTRRAKNLAELDLTYTGITKDGIFNPSNFQVLNMSTRKRPTLR